ncbi:ABC transporter ATP-binding protein, partial [Enterococcus faecalis]|nr:ABC transporter ATP-binding protein [Enterococcus faecalis]EIQ7100049.1 ABC transporter ATP-binding protein [Enterococcus faecalis]
GNKQIVSNFSFTADFGEFIIITGKSGSGKTTLINELSLLENQHSGILNYYNKSELTNKRIQLLRRNCISYMFQNYGLIESMSVLDNLKLALKFNKETDESAVDAYLEKFELSNLKKKKVSFLSGGEQQRVALIRSLLKPFDILFADEPTGNLDQENGMILVNYLQNLVTQSNKSVVMVTHDENLFQYANQIIHLTENK